MRDRLERELSERYAIERELGQGGMATVWLALDRRHERRVAIKVLHAELAGAIGADRFLREVRLTARLLHPSIVPVLDSGILPATATDAALPWYAMAFVEGESLRERLTRETQLPIDEAVRITKEVASALHAAHQLGIVHRDVKPENVLLAQGRVYVVDFGIAKALLDTGDERLTGSGLAIGTPVYMSPEQATAAPVDARSDQYSLAALAYEMLVGEPPVTGPNTQAIIARRLTAPARPIRTVRPSVPEWVEEAVLRGLERVPADRFPDVAAFARALDAPTAKDVDRTRARRTRSRLAIAGAGLAVAVSVAWMVRGRDGSRARPTSNSGSRNTAVDALYRAGMRAYDRRTTEGAVEAIGAFGAAVARDSTDSRGWVGLARTYVRIYERGFVVPGLAHDSVLPRAVVAVDHALAADSTDAEAWVAQAIVTKTVDPADVQPTIRAARRAVALDSANGPAWHFLAIGLAESGHLDQALTMWREGARRAPRYTQGLSFVALGYWWRKQYDSAAVWADSVVTMDPNYLLGRTAFGSVALARRDFARAIASFEAARRLSPDAEVPIALAGRAMGEAGEGRLAEARATLRLADSLAATHPPIALHTIVYVAGAHAQLGDVDGALAWIARYPSPEDLHFQLHLRCDPPLAPLAADARYRALLLPGTRGGQC